MFLGKEIFMLSKQKSESIIKGDISISGFIGGSGLRFVNARFLLYKFTSERFEELN